MRQCIENRQVLLTFFFFLRIKMIYSTKNRLWPVKMSKSMTLSLPLPAVTSKNNFVSEINDMKKNYLANMLSLNYPDNFFPFLIILFQVNSLFLNKCHFTPSFKCTESGTCWWRESRSPTGQYLLIIFLKAEFTYSKCQVIQRAGFTRDRVQRSLALGEFTYCSLCI